MNALKVEGEKGRTFEINLEDPLQRRGPKTKSKRTQEVESGKTVNLDGHLISYFGDLKNNRIEEMKSIPKDEFGNLTVESVFEEGIEFPARGGKGRSGSDCCNVLRQL